MAISEYFGEATFGLNRMRERLPSEAYEDLVKTLEHGRKLSRKSADAIAYVVKEWAVSRGATHFCHWFQPMTGLTAEKHDAFISIQTTTHSDVTVLERLTGTQLVQGEPDASSFPSGGMRSTFEARGYTAWDPTAALFIVEESGTKTLCIPSVFFGYHGQALDLKTPLLRSVEALSKGTCDFLKLLGDVDVKFVSATLGPEQEYFLIDKTQAARRPDLIMTGRTLIGTPTSRGQKLEEHYFGSIPPRVKAFMDDMETELYRLGVPVKTRHNEVAPGQFEMAPIFETCSLASDHNTLAMETMKRVAGRHNFLCLFHEKPFAELNGSGKHCNWSISNDKGTNLLDPGRTPHQNLRFLAIISVVIKALHEHGAVLAASITSPGNDLRLGAGEAPPSITSVYLGSMLEKVFDSIAKGEAAQATEAQLINLGISSQPNIARDYTDRNRTSPFAFTGNKFEYRAVGSSAPVSVSMTVLNAAVAHAFNESTPRLKQLIEASASRDEAVMSLIRELYDEHKAILFSGNNYSVEWRTEAKRRGLAAIGSCIEAFPILKSMQHNEFLVATKVLSADEIISRYNVKLERFVSTLEIELSTQLEMISEYVQPALEKQLLRSYKILAEVRTKLLKQQYEDHIAELEKVMSGLLSQKEKLNEALVELSILDDDDRKIALLGDRAIGIGNELRKFADHAERLVAREYWDLPRYREMLFDQPAR